MFNDGQRATGSQAMTVKLDIAKDGTFGALCLKSLTINDGIKSISFSDFCSQGQTLSQTVGLDYTFSGEFVVAKNTTAHKLVKMSNSSNIENLNNIPVQIRNELDGEITTFEAAITSISRDFPSEDAINASIEFKPSTVLTVTPIV